MTIDNILNTILYIIAGFFFGIFASRYSVIATAKILTAKKVFGLGLKLFLNCLASVIFIFIAFFFFPIWMGTFFQLLYNTADAAIVGNFLGKEALSAVGGPTATIVNLLVNFFVGLASGATVEAPSSVSQ